MRRLGVLVTVTMALALAAGTSGASGTATVGHSLAIAGLRPKSEAVTTWWVDSTWLSPLTGWVLGEGTTGRPTCAVIKRTVDGGRSWSAVPAPAGRTLISGGSTYTCWKSGGCVTHLVFANRDDGYLFGPDLFTTSDGGRTWHRQAGERTAALATVAPGVVWRLTYAGGGCPGPCDLALQQQRGGVDNLDHRTSALRRSGHRRRSSDRQYRYCSGPGGLLRKHRGWRDEPCHILRHGQPRAVLVDPSRPLWRDR